MNCVDKHNLVWNNEFAETVEFENLISQIAQRDDVQWTKHTLPRSHQNRSRAEAKEELAGAGDWTPRLHWSSTQRALISPSTSIPSLG